MEFNYKSNNFNTMTQCKKEIAKLKEELCKSLNLKRDEFKLPNGLIVLHGYSKDTQNYFPLSTKISDFSDKIKNKLYSNYYVSCNVETK